MMLRLYAREQYTRQQVSVTARCDLCYRDYKETQMYDQQFGGEHGFDQLPHDPEMVELDANFGQAYDPGAMPGAAEWAQFGQEEEEEAPAPGAAVDIPALIAALGAAAGATMTGIANVAGAAAGPEGEASAAKISGLEAQITSLTEQGRAGEAAVLKGEQNAEVENLKKLLAEREKEEKPWYTTPVALIGFTVLGIGAIYGITRVAMGSRNEYYELPAAAGW